MRIFVRFGAAVYSTEFAIIDRLSFDLSHFGEVKKKMFLFSVSFVLELGFGKSLKLRFMGIVSVRREERLKS